MTGYPAPTRNDHDTFCATEGWELVRGASGQPVQHHRTYLLTLPNGDVLRTRISKPVNSDTYGPARWRHILRDQLRVTEAEFWACVRDQVLPDRGRTEPRPPADAIPLGVVLALIEHVGLSEDAVREMSRQEAIDRLNEHWAAGGG